MIVAGSTAGEANHRVRCWGVARWDTSGAIVLQTRQALGSKESNPSVKVCPVQKMFNFFNGV
jgi:hypothetical protein